MKTGLWNLMDLYAFCVQKKLIVRLKPFSNAFQHAIKEQLRQMIIGWRQISITNRAFKLKV